MAKKKAETKKKSTKRIDDKIDILKRKLLDSLKENLGNVSRACDSVNCHRATYYDYLNDDEEFEKEVYSIKERTIDHVESKLHEKINGVQITKGRNEDGEPIVYNQPPSDTAIIFFLKTQGKKRGYIETTEFDVKTSKVKMSKEDKQARLNVLIEKSKS